MSQYIVAFMLLLSLLILHLAEAQESARVPRIGVLFPGTAGTVAPRVDAVLQGLSELGYREGNSIAI
jgi:hypothetical protein